MTDGSVTRWTLLEERVRLSESVLYEVLRNFYNRAGPSAWNDPQAHIPFYATCNTYISKWYADVVFAHLREGIRTAAIDPAHPIYIVELGAGSGAFAFYFLRKLEALREASSLRHLDVRYVMTDGSPVNVDAWTKHPYLSPLAAAGRLDFAKFDIDRDTTLALVGGATLAPGTCANPLVVLANYVLDSVRHDLFRIGQGQLCELRLSTRVAGAERPPLDQPGLLERVHIQYSTEPVVASEVYADVDLAAVVDHYQRTANTTIAIPVGAFAGLRSLLAISGQRLLLVASDKGHTTEAALYDPHPAHLTLHNGCFSMMVNFDAIRRYLERKGGFYAASPMRGTSLQTAMFVIGGSRDDHADTLLAFTDRLKYWSPGEFFDHLLDPVNYPTTVANILRFLRMAGHDPRMFCAVADRLVEDIPNVNLEIQTEVYEVALEVWANFFPGFMNVPVHLSRVMAALGRLREAERFFAISNELFGPISSPRSA